LTECCGWTGAALAVVPPEQVGTRHEMALQLAFGFSRMLTQGLTEDAHTALVRADELGKALDDLDYQLRALVGLVIFRRMSADFSRALAISRQVDAIAKEIATPLALATADCLLGSSLLWVGEYAEARTRSERAAWQNSPEVRQAHQARYGYDHRVNSQTVWAQILWLQGFAEQSMQATRDALIEAEKTPQRFTLPYVLVTTGCLVPLWVGDLATAEQSIAQLKAETQLKGLRNYYAAALGFEGMLCAARGDTAGGERLLRQSIAGLRETGFYMFYMVALTQLAEVLASGGKVGEGLAVADEALRRVREAHFQRCAPEALRIKAEILLLARTGDDAEAEDLFRQALDLAGRQGALAWELRSAASLARLRRRQCQVGEARAILASAYDRFVEGFETADLVAAKRLLDELNDAGRE
jgi:tetratricopeptide (TPR) repeat protein